MSAAFQGITGSIGACFAATCTHPIEIAKTRIQVSSGRSSKGVLQVILQVFRTEGFRGLFVGLSSQYIQTFLANFLFFFFYSIFRKRILKFYHETKDPNAEESKKQKLPASLNLLVGILAAIAQVLLITPVNVSLTRIKTNSPPANVGSNSLIPVLYKIAKREGFSRLYAGLGPSLILTINPGIEFMIVESLRDFWTSTIGQLDSSSTFTISAIAKIGATIMTYPYILAKVKMQNSGETNVMSLWQKLLKEGGIPALYTGLQIQLTKAVLFASLRNTAKEKLAKLLG